MRDRFLDDPFLRVFHKRFPLAKQGDSEFLSQKFDTVVLDAALSRSMSLRGIALWIALLISITGVAVIAAAPPALPCKNPTELVKAVEYALTNQDTNFFFRLHYWDNVPVGEQSKNKNIAFFLHFKRADDLSKMYGRFQLEPAPSDANIPRPKTPRANQVQRVPNLSVIGLISYRTRGISTGLNVEPIRYSAGGDMEYGKASDGTYWLTVDVRKKEAEPAAPVSQSARETRAVPLKEAATELSPPVSPDPSITKDPRKTLEAYIEAIRKGDRETASQLTARFAKLNEADLMWDIDTSIEFFAKRKAPMEIKESKIIENCAVVVVLDSPTDPDAVYLLKQKGRWRVFPKLTRFEPFDLADSDLKRFEALKAWYETQVGE